MRPVSRLSSCFRASPFPLMVIVTVSRLSTDRIVSPSPRRRRTQYTPLMVVNAVLDCRNFTETCGLQRNYRCVVSTVCTRRDFGHVTNGGLSARCIDAPLVASTDMSDIFVQRIRWNFVAIITMNGGVLGASI